MHCNVKSAEVPQQDISSWFWRNLRIKCNIRTGGKSFIDGKEVNFPLLDIFISDSSLSTLEERLLSRMLYFFVNACVLFCFMESLTSSSAISSFSPNSLTRPLPILVFSGWATAGGHVLLEGWLLEVRWGVYFCLLSCFHDAPVFLGLSVHVSKLVSDRGLACSLTTACVERSLQCLLGVFDSASVSLLDGQSLLVPLNVNHWLIHRILFLLYVAVHCQWIISFSSGYKQYIWSVCTFIFIILTGFVIIRWVTLIQVQCVCWECYAFLNALTILLSGMLIFEWY